MEFFIAFLHDGSSSFNFKGQNNSKAETKTKSCPYSCGSTIMKLAVTTEIANLLYWILRKSSPV